MFLSSSPLSICVLSSSDGTHPFSIAFEMGGMNSSFLLTLLSVSSTLLYWFRKSFSEIGNAALASSRSTGPHSTICDFKLTTSTTLRNKMGTFLTIFMAFISSMMLSSFEPPFSKTALMSVVSTVPNPH